MTKEELVKDGIIEKDALSVVEILEKKYPNHTFEWQEKAGRLWALCPNPKHHDTHPTNFNLYQGEDGKWHWKCFACGISGPKPSNISPIEGDIAVFREHLQEKLQHGFDNTFLDYFLQRVPGLGEEIGFDSLFSLEIGAYSKEITEKLGINEDKNEDKDINVREKIEKWGMAQYEWLVFVYRDVNGKPVFVKFRNISIPKYDPKWHDVGTKTIKLTKNTAEIGFFGDEFRSQSPVLFLLEGEFDAITTKIVTGGKYSALAMSGTSGFKKEAIEQVVKKVNIKNKPRKAIFVLPDWDNTGQVAIEKLIDETDIGFLQKNDIRTILNSPVGGIKDMDELLRGNYDDADSIISDMLKEENTVPLSKIKEQKEKEKKEKLEEIYEQYPPIVKKMAGTEEQNEFENIALQDWNKPVIEPERVFAGLARGDVGMLVAPGDTGKSYFALYISLLTASTMDFEDPFCVAHGRKVLYINYEDRPIEFVKRQRYIVSSIKNMLSENQIPMQEQEIINSFKDNFFAVSPKKTFFLFKEQRGTLQKITENFERLKEMSAGKDVLILDTWSRSALISDVSNQIASEAIAILEEFAREQNIAILLLHHTSKGANIEGRIGTDAIRGASSQYYNIKYIIQIQKINKDMNAFGNEKLVQYIKNLQNKERYILVYEGKNNYGQKNAYIYVKDELTGAPYCINLHPHYKDKEGKKQNPGFKIFI